MNASDLQRTIDMESREAFIHRIDTKYRDLMYCPLIRLGFRFTYREYQVEYMKMNEVRLINERYEREKATLSKVQWDPKDFV